MSLKEQLEEANRRIKLQESNSEGNIFHAGQLFFFFYLIDTIDDFIDLKVQSLFSV